MKQSIARPHVSHDVQEGALPESPPPPAAMGYLWSRTGMLEKISLVVRDVGAWQDVAIAPDCDGLCLTVSGVTLGQLRWNGRIDVPFGLEVRDRLVAVALLDRDDPDAAHVVLDVRGAAGVDHAVWCTSM
jgi:Luciferase